MLSRLRSQVSELWGRLTLPYKILTVGLIVAGLLSITFFAVNSNARKPDMVTLASNLDPKEAVLVKERLTEAGITHTQGGDGFTFLVKADDLFAARLALAEAGLLGGSHAGYELLDTTKLGVTEAERRVNFKRAMEGELARAIGRMQPVRSAVVFLNLPEESLFVQEREPGSASVLLELLPGQEIKPSQVSAIATFVASSVDGLSPDQVQVVDTNGRTLAAEASGDREGNLLTGEQLSLKLQLQQDLEERLQTFLEAAYGPGNVEVRVTADLDFDQMHTSETRFEVPQGSPDGQGLIISSEIEREDSSGTTAPSGGVAGTDPNAPPMYNSPGGGASESESSRRHEIINREVDRTQTTTVKAVGQVRNLSVGVVVNSSSLAEGVNPVTVEQEIARLVTSVVAADVKVTDAQGNPQEPRVQVSALPFNRDAAQAIAEAIREREQAEDPATALSTATWVSAVAGLLAILFALLALWRRRQQEQQLEPALAGVPGGLLDLSTADFEEPQAEPEPARMQREFTIEELLDPEFLAKMNENPERQAIREHVEKVVRQDPEFVAQLLRTWINED